MERRSNRHRLDENDSEVIEMFREAAKAVAEGAAEATEDKYPLGRTRAFRELAYEMTVEAVEDNIDSMVESNGRVRNRLQHLDEAQRQLDKTESVDAAPVDGTVESRIDQYLGEAGRRSSRGSRSEEMLRNIKMKLGEKGFQVDTSVGDGFDADGPGGLEVAYRPSRPGKGLLIRSGGITQATFGLPDDYDAFWEHLDKYLRGQ